jgi:hypothetical protein
MALTSKFDLVIGQRRDTIDGFCSGSENRLTSTLGQLLDLAFAQIKQAAIAKTESEVEDKVGSAHRRPSERRKPKAQVRSSSTIQGVKRAKT